MFLRRKLTGRFELRTTREFERACRQSSCFGKDEQRSFYSRILAARKDNQILNIHSNPLPNISLGSFRRQCGSLRTSLDPRPKGLRKNCRKAVFCSLRTSGSTRKKRQTPTALHNPWPG